VVKNTKAAHRAELQRRREQESKRAAAEKKARIESEMRLKVAAETERVRRMGRSVIFLM
jgi:hypothetical protein